MQQPKMFGFDSRTPDWVLLRGLDLSNPSAAAPALRGLAGQRCPAAYGWRASSTKAFR